MNNRFYVTLSCVIVINFLSGVGAGYIALVHRGEMSAALADFQQKLSGLFIAGAGAIFGLLGGRVV